MPAVKYLSSVLSLTSQTLNLQPASYQKSGGFKGTKGSRGDYAEIYN